MQDRENEGVEKVWLYRGRELRLVKGAFGFEGQIWVNGVLKARMRYGPYATLLMAIELTEQRAFGLGPLPLAEPDEERPRANP